MTQSIIQEIAKICEEKSYSLGTAESCTGGRVASAITSIAGSSAWFQGGIVSYSNQAKTNLLGVSSNLIEKHGAVSEMVAIEMAKGASSALDADIGISTTGIAGPGGGSEEKPVGLVHFGLYSRLNNQIEHFYILETGDREAIQKQATGVLLKKCLLFIKNIS